LHDDAIRSARAESQFSKDGPPMLAGNRARRQRKDVRFLVRCIVRAIVP
jgi:hypothetical protein